MGKERKIEEAIMAYVNGLGRCIKFVATPEVFGQPDIFACVRGRMVLIEVKQPGEHSRKIQEVIQNRWRKAGALVITDATSVDDVQWRLIAEGLA